MKNERCSRRFLPPKCFPILDTQYSTNHHNTQNTLNRSVVYLDRINSMSTILLSLLLQDDERAAEFVKRDIHLLFPLNSLLSNKNKVGDDLLVSDDSVDESEESTLRWWVLRIDDGPEDRRRIRDVGTRRRRRRQQQKEIKRHCFSFWIIFTHVSSVCDLWRQLKWKLDYENSGLSSAM